MITMWRKPFWAFMSLLLTLLWLPGIALAEFKDPLALTAAQQRSFQDRPLIGSARTSTRIIAVGPRGLIIFSDDSGSTWTQASVPTQSDLVAVDFPSDLKGWAVGHDGVILATTDGGSTWVKQLDGLQAGENFVEYYKAMAESGVSDVGAALELTELNYRDGPALPYLDVWFKDELTGFVVGGFGNIAGTVDGGKSWVPWVHRTSNEEGHHLYAIQGVGDDIYVSGERGTLFKLDKATQQFTRTETNYSGTFTGVAGNEHVVVAYGLQGSLYRSADEGISWKEVSGLPPSTINYGASSPDQKGFVFINQDGQLILADDQLNEFDVIEASSTMNMTSAVAVSVEKLLITTLSGIAIANLNDRTINRIRSRE